MSKKTGEIESYIGKPEHIFMLIRRHRLTIRIWPAILCIYICKKYLKILNDMRL